MMTIRIVFIIMIVARWTGHVLDVHGAFLKGDFADGETLLLKVPQGMESCTSGPGRAVALGRVPVLT
jgi:hypothetical protein